MAILGKICLFVLRLNVQSTIFQSFRNGATASWVINQYFRGVKCLAQGHNTAAVGFEPRPLAPESDTLPLSHRAPLLGNSGAIYNLNTFTKTEKNKPRLTEQIGLLVLQLNLCNFVLLQLAPFISYSLSIIVP